jgi:RimJ/RimL family protein N-acetyltransferase
MDIETLTPDSGALTEAVTLVNAVAAHDSPWVHPETSASLAGYMRHGWDGEPPRWFAARENGVLVGTAELHTSEWDNTHLAWLGIAVHPDLRGAGRGGELLGFVVDRARAAGRTSAGTNGWESPAVTAFATGHGFERRSQAINRRQYLHQLDRGLMKQLHADAEAAAAAYELVRVDGRTPEDMIEGMVTMTAAINDAPTDDLEIEDEVFTAARVRGYEDATLGRGERLHRLVARDRQSGELAGHTVVAVEEERPQIGYQHDTSVVRAHRGHRLGLLLKAAMLEWLAEAEPQLETVDTWNAESNDHMIAINDALGYRVMGRELQFQRDI